MKLNECLQTKTASEIDKNLVFEWVKTDHWTKGEFLLWSQMLVEEEQAAYAEQLRMIRGE